MSNKQYEAQLDELIERVLTSPADAFTALPDDDDALRALCRELDAKNPAGLCESLELAAAAPLLTSAESEAMPAHIKRRIEVDAAQHFKGAAAEARSANVTSIQKARQGQEPVIVERQGSGWFAGAGWLVAAGLLLAMFFGRETTPDAAPEALPEVAETQTAPVPDPNEIISAEELLARVGTISASWRQPDQPGFERVTGDVIWNDQLQQGYMRLANMPVNDTAARQYQLWIVDPDRDAEPVDGGVFDIVASTGEVLIPIDAKLPVSEPTVFAITLEQHGGVVVSEGPLIVVAPVST
ncbi:MAG: anti-sigma factor [Pseudomonadota bacterium]